MPILQSNVRDSVATALKEAIGGAFDAQDGNGLVLEFGKEFIVQMDIVKNEAGLAVSSIRVDDLEQVNTPDKNEPVIVTDDVGAGVDYETSTRQNSGGQTESRTEEQNTDNNSLRETSTGGGDNVTQEREINQYG